MEIEKGNLLVQYIFIKGDEGCKVAVFWETTTPPISSFSF